MSRPPALQARGFDMRCHRRGNKVIGPSRGGRARIMRTARTNLSRSGEAESRGSGRDGSWQLPRPRTRICDLPRAMILMAGGRVRFLKATTSLDVVLML